MSYYRTCPHCGANLDPGEVCDCQGKEKAVASIASTDGGAAEQNISPVSASNNTKETEDLQV